MQNWSRNTGGNLTKREKLYKKCRNNYYYLQKSVYPIIAYAEELKFIDTDLFSGNSCNGQDPRAIFGMAKIAMVNKQSWDEK